MFGIKTNSKISNFVFSFRGNINQTEYWQGFVTFIGVSLIYFLIPQLLLIINQGLSTILTLFFTVIWIPIFLIFYSSLSIKRLRDIGWSFWLLPLFFIPGICGITFVLCLVMPGKKCY